MPFAPPQTHALVVAATDAGDSGLLIPVIGVLAILMGIYHSPRLAFLLVRTMVLAGALIALAKLVFLSCGARWNLDLISPSGHTCLSVVTYGMIATLLGSGRSAPVRVLLACLAGVVIGAIAVTRLILQVHTVAEVLVGLGVGLLAYLSFLLPFARMEPLRIDLRVFGVALAATFLLALGIRLPAESMLRHFARHAAFSCAAPDRARAAESEGRRPVPMPTGRRAIRS